MKRILITGASGFLGRSLVKRLSFNYSIVTSSTSSKTFTHSAEHCPQNLTEAYSQRFKDWISTSSAVVHCAARAHVMEESHKEPLKKYREVNTDSTLRLARLASIEGVQRFIYISSIKVHGERNISKSKIIEDAQVRPVDPYGISKLEAEIGLREIAAETGMEVVIIRPPLIYGPGVKANFETMMNWIAKNRPLPLGRVKNSRSLVGIDNLCSLIETCIDHPNAANETFLVSDQEDVSTTELLKRLKKSLSSSSPLIPIPVPLMSVAANMIGKGTIAQRLFDDLYVSSEKATRLLGWKPPFSMQEQLDKTALHFIQHAGKHA